MRLGAGGLEGLRRIIAVPEPAQRSVKTRKPRHGSPQRRAGSADLPPLGGTRLQSPRRPPLPSPPLRCGPANIGGGGSRAGEPARAPAWQSSGDWACAWSPQSGTNVTTSTSRRGCLRPEQNRKGPVGGGAEVRAGGAAGEWDLLRLTVQIAIGYCAKEEGRGGGGNKRAESGSLLDVSSTLRKRAVQTTDHFVLNITDSWRTVEGRARSRRGGSSSFPTGREFSGVQMAPSNSPANKRHLRSSAILGLLLSACKSYPPPTTTRRASRNAEARCTFNGS